MIDLLGGCKEAVVLQVHMFGAAASPKPATGRVARAYFASLRVIADVQVVCDIEKDMVVLFAFQWICEGKFRCPSRIEILNSGMALRVQVVSALRCGHMHAVYRYGHKRCQKVPMHSRLRR